MVRTARCNCGQLELHCNGEPQRVSMCHCLDCQRRTGSIFSVAVFYGRSKVRVVHGATRRFERQSASGFPVKFHFCSECGSNVFWSHRGCRISSEWRRVRLPIRPFPSLSNLFGPAISIPGSVFPTEWRPSISIRRLRFTSAMSRRLIRRLCGSVYASVTPGLPFSTAKVFRVDTLAFGSATSEMTRSRVVIRLASTSTLT